MTLDELNIISKQVLDSAIEVHKQLGPGLLESVYEYCLCKEMELRNIKYKKQSGGRGQYGHVVEKVLPVHKAQLLSYLRLIKKRLGILINFNVPILVNGWERVINGY